MAIIDCKSCGMEIVLSTAYRNYEGEVECKSCGSLYHVKIREGVPTKVKLIEKIPLQ